MTITHLTRNHLQQNIKKRNRHNRHSILAIFSFMFIVGVSGAYLALANEVRDLYKELPSSESIQSKFDQKKENSFLYDRHGTLLYTFRDPNFDREYLPKSEITDLVRLTVLSAEDKDFYMHEGIDFLGTIRGLVTSASGEKVVGGSTITQQLVKNSFLTREQSLERKLKEAMLSLIIEKEYDKETILEYYLNTVTFGSRVTGLKTAAKNYFNKPIKDLDFNEIAFLIAIVQSPNELSPLYSYDQQKAWELNNARRQYIIKQAILNYTYFKSIFPDIPTIEQLASYLDQPIKLNPRFENILAPHFVFYILSIITKPPYNITLDDLYSKGYKIYSSLDLQMQQIAEQEVAPAVNTYGRTYGFSNGALMTVDATSGDILVMQGSKDYNGAIDPSGRFDPQVNVTLSPQNLGSSIKPFLAYIGINQAHLTRYSILMDTPQTFAGGYRPKDVDGKFLGPLTFDKALKLSRNLPWVKVLNQVGTSNFNNLLRQLGYTNAINGANYGLSAALGGVTETLFDHTFAYTALANNGVKVDPRPILRIEAPRTGEVREFSVSKRQILNPSSVLQVNKIIGDKSFTIDNHWMIYPNGCKCAGKTGTTDYNRQNYFVGYNPKVVTAVWVGNNNNDRLSSRSFGSTSALPVWYAFSRRLFSERPEYLVRGSY